MRSLSLRRPPGARPTTICSDPHCPDFATHNGRCNKHQRDVAGTGSRGGQRANELSRLVLDQARDKDGVPRCFYCNAEATVRDHYIPVAEGGTDDEANSVAACAPCNGHKGKRMPQEFMASSWLARRCADVANARADG